MLSYEESDYPVALNKAHDIIYYHKKEVKDFEKLPYHKYKITEEEADEVYRAIRGTRDSHYPANAIEYYEKAKADLKERQGKILHSPSLLFMYPQDIPNQRQFIICTGMAGSGKSWWIGSYIRLYLQLFPNHKIYIFSKKDFDEAYDVQFRSEFKDKTIVRIPLDEAFLDSDLEASDFKKSLCIFDDIENIRDKLVRKKVYELKDDLSCTGRVNNTYLLLANHLAMNYRETRVDLGEADGVVVFQSGNKLHVNNLLKTHVGLDSRQIEQVFDTLKESRWVFVKKTHPMYFVSEHSVVLF